MLVKVLSEDSLSAIDFKKILDICKNSQCPNESLLNTFPKRYQRVQTDKKSITVYFDVKKPTNHCYTHSY